MHRTSNADLAVRSARPSDVGQLSALARTTFRATYHHLADECVESHLARAATDAAFEPSIRSVGHHVAVVERATGDLVGFSHALPARHAAPIGRRPIMLSKLYLLPEHHGTGTGSALIRRVEDWAAERGHDELWLAVWVGNARAIGFYAARGFRRVGATAVRIGRCTDLDLVMSKALDPSPGKPERSGSDGRAYPRHNGSGGTDTPSRGSGGRW
jgi:GNAT superfamily N-acetyltransferase